MPDQYPQWAAGDEITAEKLMQMIPRIINKPTNTSILSTTTPTIDPDLQMELEPNATYFVEFHIHYAALESVGFRTDWTVPSGTTGNKCIIGMAEDGYSWTNSEAGMGGTDAGNANNTLGRFGVHAFATDVNYGTRNHATNQAYALETATVITGGTGGTVGLNWSQRVSDGSNAATVFATSLMRVTRLQ
jgi:hypothetical protein